MVFIFIVTVREVGNQEKYKGADRNARTID